MMQHLNILNTKLRGKNKLFLNFLNLTNKKEKQTKLKQKIKIYNKIMKDKNF